MKGALRVAALLFGALPIQKWLLCIGVLLIVLGFFLSAQSFGVLALLGVIFPLVPSLFAGGLLLRHFVAPRSVRLIPHAREQVLGGMVLFALAITTAVTLALGNLMSTPADLLPLMWLRVATLASLLLLSQFLLVSSTAGAGLWLVMFIGFMEATTSASVRKLLESIAGSPGSLVAITLVAWVGFTLWFLRAPTLKGPTDGIVQAARVTRVSATPETAIRTFLFGNPSVLNQFMGGFLCAAFITLVWGSVFVLLHESPHFADAVVRAMGAAMGIGTYAGLGGWMVARRSRSLWLRGGLGRMELFRLCEAQAWKSFGATSVSILLLLAIAWLLDPSVGIRYAVLLAFYFCAGICLVYWGLMHVRGWRALDMASGVVLFLVWIMSFVTAQIVLKTLWLMPVLIAAMLGAAVVLRLVAIHRWQRIDWLVCELPRYPARDSVRLAH